MVVIYQRCRPCIALALFLILLYLTTSVKATNSPSCVWKDGSPAVTHPSNGPSRTLVACNPDAAASSASSCCLQGDSCLASGMCYGSAGMPYRGACTDPAKYGTPECPDNCIDLIPSSVANMYGCTSGVQNNGGILTFWCGLGTPCDNSTENNGETTAKGWFPNGVVVKAANTITSTSASGTVTGGSIASASMTACSSTSTTASPDQTSCVTCHEGAVGGGVGAGLSAIILCLCVLLLFERRKKQTAVALAMGARKADGSHSRPMSTSAATVPWHRGGQPPHLTSDAKQDSWGPKPEMPDTQKPFRAELGDSRSIK